jgi:hypothetical protein
MQKPSIPYSVIIFVTDALITTTMCHLLRQHRSEYVQCVEFCPPLDQ